MILLCIHDFVDISRACSREGPPPPVFFSLLRGWIMSMLIFPGGVRFSKLPNLHNSFLGVGTKDGQEP